MQQETGLLLHAYFLPDESKINHQIIKTESMKILNLIDAWLARIETFLLIFLLSAMILLAFFQIPLNRFFPVEDIETLLRHLVLWVGFLGATLATREGRHINIDVLSRFVRGNRKRTIKILSNLFAALICSLLTDAAIQVVTDAREFKESVQIFIEVPTWILQLIFIFGFGMMTFRFVLQALNITVSWLSGKKGEETA